VYIADETTLNRRELYIVNIANPGNPVRINAPLTVNRDVIDFAVSPDGSQVVYRADQDADDVFELYRVNTAQPGNAVKLSGALTPNGWVRSGFVFSPDGAHVAYRADQEVVDRLELYLVDVATPGSSKKLNSSLVTGGNVYTSFEFSPDSSTVGYVADQEQDDVLELFAAPIVTPGTTKKLNGTLTAGGDVCRFEWSPDSTRVAYCADQDTDEVMELYTVPLASPGQAVKVNPPLVSGGKVTSGYDFSPDSSFIVYAANQDSATRTEVYRADLATLGAATKVNASLPAGGNVIGFHISPDGKRVGYTANQDDTAVYEVYETDLTSPGVAQKISAPMKMSGVFSFRYSSDGGQIVYLADQDSDASEIYRVDLAAVGVATKLNSALTAGGEVWDYVIVP
jgi:Tol biopolymer transport system component